MAGNRGANVIGVLLAGGQSRRMGGGDKGLLPFGGGTLMGHVIGRLEPQVDAIIINANGDHRRFSRYNLPVVADPCEGFAGPLAGVLAGMIWAQAMRPHALWLATAACDTPFFPEDYVIRLLEATGGRYPAIALSASGGQVHPVFGLWPVALAADLSEALGSGTRKVLDWTSRHPTVTFEFKAIEADGHQIDPFFNANTPEELAQAEAIWDQAAARTS